ncbi:MAG: hypothetical protein WCV50_02215 [Patescibacteria group bacterium]|jgi:hypothetical protein
MFFNRFLPYLSSLLVVIFFEIWSVSHGLFYYIVSINVCIIVLTIWSLTGRKFKSKLFWNFLSTPLFLVAGSQVFFTLIDSIVIQQVFIFLIGILFFLVLKNLFKFLNQDKSYQPYALENLYGYINMVILFLFYASFFGLSLFMNWPSWLFSIVVFVISGFLYMRTLWSYKIEWRKSKFFILLVGVLMSESYFVFSFLPTSFLFNGLFLAIIYYLVMNLSRDFLRNNLNKQNIRTYIIISATLGVFLLATAKWY